MTTNRVLLLALLLAPSAALAQGPGAQEDVRARLLARGLPVEVAESVAITARETQGRGLDSRPVVDKAVEGWFKHVPAARILAAVRDLADRMDRVRTELRAEGLAQVDAAILGGAAEARSQGIARADAVAIIRAAPGAEAAGSGLSVSAALVVQGLDTRTSARLVVESFRKGRSASQVLDLPAAARALQVRGASGSEVGRELLEGLGHGDDQGSGSDRGGDRSGRNRPRSPMIPPGVKPD